MEQVDLFLLNSDEITRVQTRLHLWYKQNCRLLPWREVSDPYLIWISEVILQQTRVDQALDYYQKFVTQFPTVVHLASADENSVLKCWQGLGYYSRARNLHASAKIIATHFNGEFPKTYAEIRQLKGVGDYTAAAICSFAYNLPYAVLDGNVYRFLSRYFSLETPIDTIAGKHEFSHLADLLLNKENPALHNQAMMEMGAIQCVVKNPKCELCPLNDSCKARKYGLVDLYPIKSKKVKKRNRYFYYFFIKYKESIFLRQRSEADVWRKLYEFPLLETDFSISSEEVVRHESVQKFLKNGFFLKRISNVKKHVLSHQHIYAQCFYVEINEVNAYLLDNYECVGFNDVENYPISRLVEIFMNEYLEM